MEQADFFTMGYEGRRIEDLMSALRAAEIRLLLDIRHSPVSVSTRAEQTEFSRVAGAGRFEYLHIPQWGVPRAVRAQAIEAGSREPIWEWYDENVVEPFFAKNLHRFLNMEHPLAMMCMEADPVECHRHRLFLALEKQGLRGFDL